MKVIDPCVMFDEEGGPQADNGGCGAFVRELGLVTISEGTQPADKDYTPDPRILPVCL